MKSSNIEKLIIDLDNRLREKITEIGTGNAVKITGEDQSTLSQYIRGKRRFSYEKILEIAKKFTKM